MKSLTELTQENFDDILSRADIPVVVDFFAPWCGPCKMIAPILEQVAAHYAGRIDFYKVNVDESPELAERFQITGVPTLVFIGHGEVRETLVGFPPPQVLLEKLDTLAQSRSQTQSETAP